MNMNLLNDILTEALRQWNDFKEERDKEGCTVEDFVKFTMEIADTDFLLEEM